MAILTMRPYAGEADLAPIAELANICAVHDQLDATTSVEELRVDFDDPDFDVRHDLRLWHDERDRLIADGQLWISVPPSGSNEADPAEPNSAEPNSNLDGYLGFRVHPDARGQGLEAEIFSWAETRMRQLQQTYGVPTKLRVSSRKTLGDRITPIEKADFVHDRSFLIMKRSLLEPIPDPQLPLGFTVDSPKGDAGAAAWVAMCNQSFIDHWNFHPVTVANYHHWLKDPNYRADLNLVAMANDGTFAGFCYCYIDQPDNARRQCREGWVSSLGTRRGFRRMGLGRAMLLTGLHQLKTAGMDTALLDVDTQNPNFAYRLYDSVGFQTLYCSLSYVKDLTPQSELR